jgi:hypothetical protein
VSSKNQKIAFKKAYTKKEIKMPASFFLFYQSLNSLTDNKIELKKSFSLCNYNCPHTTSPYNKQTTNPTTNPTTNTNLF